MRLLCPFIGHDSVPKRYKNSRHPVCQDSLAVIYADKTSRHELGIAAILRIHGTNLFAKAFDQSAELGKISCTTADFALAQSFGLVEHPRIPYFAGTTYHKLIVLVSIRRRSRTEN
jgi:hypothetical protein